MATKTTNTEHFIKHHEQDGNVLCVQQNGQCMVAVELKDTDPEQDSAFELATTNAFNALDIFMVKNDIGMTSAELFSGLHIKIGDGLTESGGQAFAEENRIIFDRQKSIMSLSEAEAFLVGEGVLNPGDWTKALPSDSVDRQGTCLEYNLIHEMAHILDGQGDGAKYHRIPVTESPTKYGEVKEKECFAECFTHLVLGQEISEVARETILTQLREKASRISVGAAHS